MKKAVTPDMLAQALAGPDRLMAPPRNPARMPQAVENVAADMTVNPLWDVAQGVGAVATGNAGAPEVGAGIMSGLGMMSPMSPAIFAGPMAKTANKTAMALAEQLQKRGASRDEIWNQTGWFQGADKKWRFEIPDQNLRVSKGEGTGLTGESGVIAHPELAAAYPDAQLSHSVKTGFMQPFEGALDRSATPPMLSASAKTGGAARGAVAHELQHFVQGQEGFARGTNPEAEARRLAAIMGGRDDLVMSNVADKMYHRNAGEVEARNVQNRLYLTPEQRRAAPPWMTQDVPDERQIIRGLAEALMPQAK